MSSAFINQYGLGGRFERALSSQASPISKEGSDEYWMEKALLISMSSIGISSPNPAVGCVVVKDQKEIAEGFTQEFRKEHAERMAVQSIKNPQELSGATVYVTLEPCAHFGSQPPCVDLLLGKGLERVVIAAKDPFKQVDGEGIRKLRESGVSVEVGVLEREAKLWNFPFLKSIEKKSPVWIAKWAQTPKGYLADRFGKSKWITNQKSRAYTHWLRQKYDGIVVGAQTYLKDQPSLTVRDCAEPIQRHPDPFVFDPKGVLLGKAFSHSKVGGKVFICESALRSQTSIPEWIVPIEGDSSDPDLWVRFQHAVEGVSRSRPLQSIMVEGGATLLRGMLEQDIFDAAHVFTGTSEFLENDERYQMGKFGGLKWRCASSYHFDSDYLQEWVKGF